MTPEAARGRWAILALILTAQTVANVGPLGLPAIAPLIRDDLGLTLSQAGSFVSAYYVGPVLMSLPAGALSDRWGVRPTLVLGQVVIALGLVAASGATSYAVLVPLLIFAGCGYGMLNPTSTKAVLGWFPLSQRATVVGLKQVGLPFGGMLGAALLPVLAVALGWRAAVAVAASSIALGATVSWLLYREAPGESVARTSAARAPLRDVLLSRDLWLVAVATLVFAAMQTVWMAFLVLYLQSAVGLPLLVASRYLAVAQLGGMVGRVAFGLLSDLVFAGRRRTSLVIAGCGSTLCSLAIAGTGRDAAAGWLLPLAFVFGVVGIGWNGVQHTLMAELAGPRSAGAAVGLGLAISSAGVMLGPPAFGLAVELAGGYHGPWIGLGVAMLGGLALLMLVRERPRLA